MSFTVYVQMKKIGRQKRTEIKPVPYELDERPRTVRELLIGLTKQGVHQYNTHRDDGQILAYLTQDEIEAQAVRGKVSSGLHGGADAVEDKAIANTLQCFEDGIYRVFAGDGELTALSDEISWTEDMVFTLIRLTMLAGL